MADSILAKIRRREFLQRLAAVGAASALPATASTGAGNPSPRLDSASAQGRVGAIRTTIPAFQIPTYSGERYGDTVPDTYDIAERASLALSALTRLTDPSIDYEQYFLSVFYKNPPVLRHESSDPFVQPKFYEALPLMRVITGSDLNNHIDPIWMQSVLKGIGPDGLYYTSAHGRPWIRQGITAWMPNILLPDGTLGSTKDAPLDQISNQTLDGRIIGTMTLYSLWDGNPMWKRAIERMVDRWAELLIEKDDYGYYPVALLVPDAKLDRHAPMPTGLLGAENAHRLIQGLAQYYRASGYEPALRLAMKLSRYERYRAGFFDLDGMFIDRHAGVPAGHFHSHTWGLLALLDLALASGDRDLAAFVRSSFEWARGHAYGCALTGYYPEAVLKDYPRCEGCCVADMTALALKLSEAGFGDYYDDAERWLRNQFAEAQLTETQWVYPVAATLKRSPVQYNETSDHAVDRSLGAFAGYTSGNDYDITSGGVMDPTGVANCCTGNGTRTIYYAWQRMLDYKNNVLRVHLLLNRASPWADVHSYIPNQGRLDLRIKKPCGNVLVRVPEWIDDRSPSVSCQLNGMSPPVVWSGRYLSAGAVKPGDLLVFSLPISERQVKERIGGVDYVLQMRGNTVVEVSPAGKLSPRYQRAAYRNSEVRWKRVQRFVSTERIDW